MQAGIIRNGVVETVIEATDIQTVRETEQYAAAMVVERTAGRFFGPGWTTPDNGNTFVSPLPEQLPSADASDAGSDQGNPL